MAPQKKKTIAFKSTPTISDDDEEDDDDEDLSLLVKNVRMMYNKAKINNRRRWQGNEEKKIICFNCQKPEHIIAECLEIKNKPSFSNKPLHQRSHIRRKLSKLHEIQKVNPKRSWTRETCILWQIITHLRYLLNYPLMIVI